MGARDRKDKKQSFRMMSGDARMDEMVCGFGDGDRATV